MEFGFGFAEKRSFEMTTMGLVDLQMGKGVRWDDSTEQFVDR